MLLVYQLLIKKSLKNTTHDLTLLTLENDVGYVLYSTVVELLGFV